MKTRRAKDKVKPPEVGDVDDVDDDDSESLEYSADQAAQDVEYLKMTPYNQNTAKLIEEKLQLTSIYRHNMLGESGVNVVKQFPYMIAHPHLVRYFGFDFHYRHKIQTILPQILQDYSFMTSNGTAFMDKWPIYSKYVLSTLALREKDADFFTCFSSDIEEMLALLKLVTPKPKNISKKKNNGNWFQRVVDDFIVFVPVST